MNEVIATEKEGPGKRLYRPMRMAEMLAVILPSPWRFTCPDIVKLAEIALSIPLQTVACETGFSVLKLIKTVLRSCMSGTMLDDLMMICIEGPDPDDFLYADAVRIWYKLCHRRLHISNLDKCQPLNV